MNEDSVKKKMIIHELKQNNSNGKKQHDYY